MKQLKGILFIDIETVPLQPDFAFLTESMQSEWERKARFVKSSIEGVTEPAALFNEKAGIFSEFGKVVCIGFGSITGQEGDWKMRLKALVNEDERTLLTDFSDMLRKFGDIHKEISFCGHNIKEFDIPYLCRRMVINGLQLPECMQIAGKKPWEVTHIDTMDLWRFGDYKNFTSLSLLATVLGIPSPKTDLDGSMVADVFWKDKDLPRIAKYCLQDVYSTAKVYLRLKGMTGIDPEAVYV
jgi:3'-5' exonuclease